jgi:hypothetical protein
MKGKVNMAIKRFSTYAVDSDTVLKRVAELFSKPKNWTQGAWARNEQGFRLEMEDNVSERKAACSDKACGVCTMSGVYRAKGTVAAETVAMRRLALAIVSRYGNKSWNNSTGWTVDRVMNAKKDDIRSLIVAFNDSSSTSFRHVQKAVAAARGLA